MTPAHPPAPPSQEERQRMLAGVEAIIRQHVRLARGLGRRHRQDADDLYQNAWLQLWTASERFRADGGAKWSTFAFRTLDGLRLQMHAADKPPGPIDPSAFDDFTDTTLPDPAADEPDSPASADLFEQLATAVRRALADGLLDKLDAAHRRLVEVVAFDGLTTDQAAEQLGKSPAAVAKILRTALRTLCRGGLTSHAVPDAELAAVAGEVRPLRGTHDARAELLTGRRAEAYGELCAAVEGMARAADWPARLARLTRHIPGRLASRRALAGRVSTAVERIAAGGVSREDAARLLGMTEILAVQVLKKAVRKLALDAADYEREHRASLETFRRAQKQYKQRRREQRRKQRALAAAV